MSPLLLKLERAVANSISAREHRIRLENELASARNNEECRQHELQEALKQFRVSTANDTDPNNRMHNTPAAEFQAASGTSLTPDAAQALLRKFNGIRD
jgi:hypothetical protein